MDESSVQWVIENINHAEGNKFKIVQNLIFVSKGDFHWRVKFVRHGYSPSLGFYLDPAAECHLPVDTILSFTILSTG
jgi:hypothetical protein